MTYERAAVTIYVLIDAAGCRRYIGKSAHVAGRMRRHRLKFDWMASWIALEECGAHEWQERERWWIAHGRAQGWPLINIAAGGNAVPAGVHLGKPKTIQHRQKLSAALLGKPISDKQRIAYDARRGKPLSDEHRAKVSAGLRGRTKSLETRARMSAAQRGKPLGARSATVAMARRGVPRSVETRAAISKSWEKRRLKGVSDDTRAKLSAAGVGRQVSAATRAKISASKRGMQTPLRERDACGRFCAGGRL